jgi:hypothetical protein
VWGLLTRAWWKWLWKYLKVVFTKREQFAEYEQPFTERPGVYSIPSTCVIALAADWGTGTASAYAVRDQIRARRPDITIHLGDVYYSGTDQEFKDFFLGEDDWPRGSLQRAGPRSAGGTYTLNANHEMYSGGTGYFRVALPSLGQQTSYFCLENEHWRFVAIDTGYFSRSVPLLERIPALHHLHTANLAWLERVVFADRTDRRPVVLLSHHQWFSAYDSEYKRIGKQVRPFLDRVLLWFWGHEHRFAGYAPFGFDGASVRARCIGHGGMPIELGGQPKQDRNRPLVFADDRENPDASAALGDRIGYCGFAVVSLVGARLEVEYVDEKGEVLLTERWMRDGERLVGSASGGNKLRVFGRPLSALVS